MSDDLYELTTELVRDAEARNRCNAQEMYDALIRIISECNRNDPHIPHIKRLAQVAIGQK